MQGLCDLSLIFTPGSNQKEFQPFYSAITKFADLESQLLVKEKDHLLENSLSFHGNLTSLLTSV